MVTPAAWKRARATPSLEGVHHSVKIATGSWFKRLLSFAGPGYLVAVGYMDPGNWATDLAGGSAFGFALLSVILLSNIMAIVLQALALRLGLVTGRDLAQACSDHFSKPIALLLWLMAELAIIATDVAEVIGTAIALMLLFNTPIPLGVLLASLTAMLALLLQSRGFRTLEAFVIGLIALVAVSFIVQLALAHPPLAAIWGGFIPTTELIFNPDMLYLAIGIIGATVMPHNLYLHSGIVQTRAIGVHEQDKREAIKFATIDSTFALMFALLINASILILAASTFHQNGQTGVTEIQAAHQMLQPLLGSILAPLLFGVALLACGINSTLTATLAGQIVMEGFLQLKLKLWQRQIFTRLVALVPALTVALLYGASGTARLLILSQVILSLQLPFAVVPLIMFTSSHRKMGVFVSPLWLKLCACSIALIIIALNITMLWQFFTAH